MLEDVEYRGVTFPEGTIVLVAAVTANRDGVEDGARLRHHAPSAAGASR